MLRDTCGPKGEEVRGEWRKLHTEEPCDLHCSPYVGVIRSRKLRWRGLARNGGDRNACRVLVANYEGMRSLGRYRRRQEYS